MTDHGSGCNEERIGFLMGFEERLSEEGDRNGVEERKEDLREFIFEEYGSVCRENFEQLLGIWWSTEQPALLAVANVLPAMDQFEIMVKLHGNPRTFHIPVQMD